VTWRVPGCLAYILSIDKLAPMLRARSYIPLTPECLGFSSWIRISFMNWSCTLQKTGSKTMTPMTNHLKDRHVLAAAVHTRAQNHRFL